MINIMIKIVLYLRYYVHVSIVEKFLDKLAAYARSLVVGDPVHNAHTKMGPVVSKEHYNKIKSYIDLAVQNGNRIVCGETVE